MYKLKQIPEDFIVKERIRLSLNRQGHYCYYLLKKRNLTTEKAVQIVAEKLGIKRKLINYAGNKDKNAATEQVISINAPITTSFKIRNLELRYLGKGDNRVNLGCLEGNDFEITVRNIEDIKMPKSLIFPNYFDEQRFGKENVEVGLLILKGDFRRAADLIELEVEGNDCVGALKKVPKYTARLYVNAVQSLIFNNAVAKYLEIEGVKKIKYSRGVFVFPPDYPENKKVPLVGFGTELGNDKFSKLIMKELNRLGITNEDFLIRQIPELSSEGGERDLLAETEIDGMIKNDDLNKGKKIAIIKFFLPKGSYATIAVKALFYGLTD